MMDLVIEFTSEQIVEPRRAAGLRETGAEVEFRGIVREGEDGRTISGLEYEAHVPMARRELEKIVARLTQEWQEWPVQGVWFIHRTGWVPVGEASLYIRVHARRREAAFRFCMALVDLLKKDVPVWKSSAANTVRE